MTDGKVLPDHQEGEQVESLSAERIEEWRRVFEHEWSWGNKQQLYALCSMALRTERLQRELEQAQQKLAARRPFSDELADKVIAGQVKEIDRLHTVIASDRRSLAELRERCARVIESRADMIAQGIDGIPNAIDRMRARDKVALLHECAAALRALQEES